jgi:hypothetical protein
MLINLLEKNMTEMTMNPETTTVDTTPVVVKKKTARPGSNLAKAVDIVSQTGKDDRESCLKAIVEGLGVKRGNATIYYSKSLALLNQDGC